MKLSKVPSTKTVAAGDYHVTTEQVYSHAAGAFRIRLNPDAGSLPSVRPWLTPDQARQLAADLIAQADEADKRNQPEPVKWAGRTFGQLSPDEKRRASAQAAGQLQAELQAAAPAIGKVLDQVSEVDAAEFHATVTSVEEFLAEALARDDMSLAEIAANVTAIARGEA